MPIPQKNKTKYTGQYGIIHINIENMSDYEKKYEFQWYYTKNKGKYVEINC